MGESSQVHLLTCAVSARGGWIFALGEDRNLYCFSTQSDAVEHVVSLGLKDIVGLVHHPHRNLLASYGEDGLLNLWQP